VIGSLYSQSDVSTNEPNELLKEADSQRNAFPRRLYRLVSVCAYFSFYFFVTKAWMCRTSHVVFPLHSSHLAICVIYC